MDDCGYSPESLAVDGWEAIGLTRFPLDLTGSMWRFILAVFRS